MSRETEHDERQLAPAMLTSTNTGNPIALELLWRCHKRTKILSKVALKFIEGCLI